MYIYIEREREMSYDREIYIYIRLIAFLCHIILHHNVRNLDYNGVICYQKIFNLMSSRKVAAAVSNMCNIPLYVFQYILHHSYAI